MNMKLLALLLIVMASHWLLLVIQAADEDPLQNFCVADYSSPATLNGFPCLSPNRVRSSDFKSSLLQVEGPLEINLGLAINLVTAARAPGLNTMGLSIARINFKPRGVNPPHVHPRANELFYLAHGALTVGLVTTNNILYKETLKAGDFFVFPRGLMHFQINYDEDTPALAFAFFNSQNPGVLRLAASIFASDPPVPDAVLETAFAIGETAIESLRASVATTLKIEGQQVAAPYSSYY